MCTCYPQQTAGFTQEIMDLLDSHYAVLNSALRQSLVKSLILLRNRGHLKSAEVLPLFFRLFRCQDKALRDLLFKHIVSGQFACSVAAVIYCNAIPLPSKTDYSTGSSSADSTAWLRSMTATNSSRSAVLICLNVQPFLAYVTKHKQTDYSSPSAEPNTHVYIYVSGLQSRTGRCI